MTTTTPEAAFAQALADFQAEIPHIAKGQKATVKSDKGSYSYEYADLTDITAAAMPLLSKHGLSWSSAPTISEHGFILRYSLLHTAGHREGGEFPLPDPSRFTAQQIGSWLTYARRYALCAVTGIAPGGDDDDAAKAGDARSVDISASKRATRRGARDMGDPATAPDDFAAPAEATTDLAWMDGFEKRITAAGTPAELRELWREAAQVFAEGRLSQVDSGALKQAIDSRAAELKGDAA
jgi:hypothetical protein